MNTYTALTRYERQQVRDWSVVRIQPNAEREAYRRVPKANAARMHVINCHLLRIFSWGIWV